VVREQLIEREAGVLLRQMNVTAPPVDVLAAIRLCGVAVRRVPALPGGMRAHYDPARAEIVVVEGLRDVEERFALAHELGHHVLDHGSSACWDLGLLAGNAPIEDLDVGPDFEQEAHAFARELLVPRGLYRTDLERGRSPNDLAPSYGVSQTVAWIALERYRFRLKRKPR
jgi:Zn-dependent peptidase ImmA (M78 family)